MTDIAASSPPDRPTSPWRRIFLGPHGLRAGWSLLIFLIVCELPSGLAGLALQRAGALPEHPAWDPGLLLAFEAFSFFVVLVGIALMGWIEGRTFAAYGFPFREAFGRKFWTGSLWGILSIAAVVGMMALAGGYSVYGLAIHGGEAVKGAVLWALATLAIGLYEENYFRGYTLFTL